MSPEEYFDNISRREKYLQRGSHNGSTGFKSGFNFFKENKLAGGDYDNADGSGPGTISMKDKK